MNDTQHIDPNEAKEVSILKRNLRLLKRLVLGKKEPPMFLKILSWGFLGWSLLMIIGFLFIGLSGSLLNAFDGTRNEVCELTPKYFFTYALVHAVSILGVVLMYRRRLTGLYVFAIANLVMPFWSFIITRCFDKFEWWILIFSLASIGLFALNWNQFLANIRRREKQQTNAVQSQDQ